MGAAPFVSAAGNEHHLPPNHLRKIQSSGMEGDFRNGPNYLVD